MNFSADESEFLNTLFVADMFATLALDYVRQQRVRQQIDRFGARRTNFHVFCLVVDDYGC